MNVLVFGGSGRTGRQVLARALASGHDVTAVVRDPARLDIRHPRLRIVPGDALDATSFDPALSGQDAVVSVLGVTGFLRSLRPMTFHRDSGEAIVRAMQRHGVRRIVVVTSIGVLRHASTPWWYRAVVRPLLRHKYDDMRAFEATVRGAGLDATIVRPARLVDGSPTRCYRTAVDDVVPHGFTVSRADLADFLVAHLVDERVYGRAVAIAD